MKAYDWSRRRYSEESERRLPLVREGDALDATELSPCRVTPPSRRPGSTEPTLVAKLEELGAGRPSTYASIIETIQNRGDVWKKGSALVPSLDRLRRHHHARTAFRRTGGLRLHP